jgi:predicted nucleic-acid-binding Zn-ribbon protein
MQSFCPKCNNSKFESQETKLTNGENQYVLLIQCDKCGCVVGAVDNGAVNKAVAIILEELRKEK